MKQSLTPNFLRVITPQFLGYYTEETGPAFAYSYAISYRRTSTSRWGDSFWIVPGTLDLEA